MGGPSPAAALGAPPGCRAAPRAADKKEHDSLRAPKTMSRGCVAEFVRIRVGPSEFLRIRLQNLILLGVLNKHHRKACVSSNSLTACTRQSPSNARHRRTG